MRFHCNSIKIIIVCFLFIVLSSPTTKVSAITASKPRIALVMKALSNPFFSKMQEGAKRFSLANNITLDVFGVDRETDVELQISMVENLLSRDYGAIVIAPADSVKLVPVCKKAIDRGIVVINIDNPLSQEEQKKYSIDIPFIGSDNRAGATMVGEYIRQKLGGVGNVLVLEGIRGVENADLRKAGFVEAVTKNSAIKILASESANWHTAEAFSLTTTLLAKFPQVDALFCANDNMALGALQALQLLGLDQRVLIGSYDNVDLVREQMRNGLIHATVEQHPQLMARW